MKTVGITGGIGSGKSTVANVFNAIGIPVFNSDKEAKKILYSEELQVQIKNKFGDKVFPGNEFSKEKLASVVFSNQQYLNWLNAQIHPKVKREFESWKTNYSNMPYVVKEAALLLGEKEKGGLDYLIVVAAEMENRLERVEKRDGRSIEEIKSIISKQASESEFMGEADFVIKNNDEFVVPQVLKVHSELVKL